MATYSTASKKLITRRVFDMIFTPESKTAGGSISGATINASSVSTRTTPARSITIYSGVQPTAQDVAANWTAYNNSNSICLAHYSSGISFSYNSGTLTYYFTNTTNSITTTALNSGTATWAIIWMANNVNISLTSIPASSKFVVVPVSDTSGIGVIRYTDTAAVSGQPFLPYDGGLSITEV